jgi:6-phosphogluconate dehydrogenase
MQLIAEAYDILKRGLGLHEDEISDIFTQWNKGVLDSFLIEITANILKFKDDDGEPVLTKILDKAGQKGTGKWTAIAALESGTAGTFYSPDTQFKQLNMSSHLDRRGCLCSLPLCYQGRAHSRLQDHPWSKEGDIQGR